jgi:hypothetical protein
LRHLRRVRRRRCFLGRLKDGMGAETLWEEMRVGDELRAIETVHATAFCSDPALSVMPLAERFGVTPRSPSFTKMLRTFGGSG